MRSKFNRKSLAVAYGLGLTWALAVVGGSVLLSPPLLELYNVIGIESVAVHIVTTMVLVLLLATTVTLAIGLALRSVANHAPRYHTKPNPKVASHHA